MTTSERYSNLVDAKLRNELVLKDGTIFKATPHKGIKKSHGQPKPAGRVENSHVLLAKAD